MKYILCLFWVWHISNVLVCRVSTVSWIKYLLWVWHISDGMCRVSPVSWINYIFECDIFLMVYVQGQHCILDIHLGSVERLHHNQIFPIVLLIKFKSVKQIKEVHTAVQLTAWGHCWGGGDHTMQALLETFISDGY